ncbi:MAG: hypothetical protein JWM42_295, partial [Burkholderia sp.]|nr:hypothetical protein [Burkholderia sp.]
NAPVWKPVFVTLCQLNLLLFGKKVAPDKGFEFLDDWLGDSIGAL